MKTVSSTGSTSRLRKIGRRFQERSGSETVRSAVRPVQTAAVPTVPARRHSVPEQLPVAVRAVARLPGVSQPGLPGRLPAARVPRVQRSRPQTFRFPTVPGAGGPAGVRRFQVWNAAEKVQQEPAWTRRFPAAGQILSGTPIRRVPRTRVLIRHRARRT